MIPMVVYFQRSIVYAVIPAIQDVKSHLSSDDHDDGALDRGSSLPSKYATLLTDFHAKHLGTVRQTFSFLA